MMDAEAERLREELTDRENDLRYEYLRRVEAEDTIDKVKQALHIAAAGVSAVDTAEQMYEELTAASAEVERLRKSLDEVEELALWLIGSVTDDELSFDAALALDKLTNWCEVYGASKE